MKHLFTCLLVSVIVSCGAVYGQQTNIYPGLTGDDLIENLVENYKTTYVLTYEEARDTIFGLIYNNNPDGVVECVYSGYTMNMPSTGDPTDHAYAASMNLEHSFPQSKGAGSGNGNSDMHHLYPVHSSVNSSRQNDPFAEINDNIVSKWWLNGIAYSTKPDDNIEAYSEKYIDPSGFNTGNDRFEPREVHKGNVARAMFYFYTMYRDDADAADPDFFPPQMLTLYKWHVQDPPDSWEYYRNNLISNYQDEIRNPFILDTSLIRRAYFPNGIPDAIAETSRSTGNYLAHNYPNPFKNTTYIDYSLPRAANVQLLVYDLLGKEVEILVNEPKPAGNYTVSWNGKDKSGKNVPEGIYFYEIKVKNEQGTHTETHRMLLQL